MPAETVWLFFALVAILTGNMALTFLMMSRR